MSIFFWQLFWYLLLYDSFSSINLFFGSSFSVFSFTVVLPVPILYGSSVCVYPFAVVLSSFGNSSGIYCFTTVLPVSIVLRQFFRCQYIFSSSFNYFLAAILPVFSFAVVLLVCIILYQYSESWQQTTDQKSKWRQSITRIWCVRHDHWGRKSNPSIRITTVNLESKSHLERINVINKLNCGLV